MRRTRKGAAPGPSGCTGEHVWVLLIEKRAGSLRAARQRLRNFLVFSHGPFRILVVMRAAPKRGKRGNNRIPHVVLVRLRTACGAARRLSPFVRDCLSQHANIHTSAPRQDPRIWNNAEEKLLRLPADVAAGGQTLPTAYHCTSVGLGLQRSNATWQRGLLGAHAPGSSQAPSPVCWPWMRGCGQQTPSPPAQLRMPRGICAPRDTRRLPGPPRRQGSRKRPLKGLGQAPAVRAGNIEAAQLLDKRARPCVCGDCCCASAPGFRLKQQSVLLPTKANLDSSVSGHELYTDVGLRRGGVLPICMPPGACPLERLAAGARQPCRDGAARPGADTTLGSGSRRSQTPDVDGTRTGLARQSYRFRWS